MTLINIRNLGVTLNAPLFSRLDLSINAGDRIGLVGSEQVLHDGADHAWLHRAVGVLDDVVNEAFGLGEEDELGEGFSEDGRSEKKNEKCNRRDAEYAEKDAEPSRKWI